MKAKWESISNKWVDHIPHNIRSATIYELKRLNFSSVKKMTSENKKREVLFTALSKSARASSQ